MHRFYFSRLGLCNKADENGSANPGGGNGSEAGSSAKQAEGEKGKELTAAEALAKVKDTSVPLGQRIALAIDALTGGAATITNANEAAKQAAEALEGVKAQLQAKEQELATAQANLKTANERITALEKERGEIEASLQGLQAKDMDVEKRAAGKAKEQLGALGFAAGKLPKADDETRAELPANEAKLEEALKACKTHEERSKLLRSYNAAKASKN